MLIMHRRSARPMLALALCPGPSAPKPEATGPQLCRPGPLTKISGAVQWVVDCISAKSKSGSSTALTAAITMGMWSGKQPAITAAVATLPTVAAPFPGPILPNCKSASSPVAKTKASTLSGVGITTGRPSVQPASCNISNAALSSIACISSVIFQTTNNSCHHRLGHTAQMRAAGARQWMG